MQVPEKNPTAGPSLSGLLALPSPPEMNRKRGASENSEDEENKQPKKMKLSAVGSNDWGPPKPDFKERVIGRAKRSVESGSLDDLLYSLGLPPVLGCNLMYDAPKDRLSFCDVEILINQEHRNLKCGECEHVIKQNVKKPGEFHRMEKIMKKHILHSHFNIYEFNCSRCGASFTKKGSLENHRCPGDKMENQQAAAAGSSAQSDGQIDQVQISATEDVGQVKLEEGEKMEVDEEMLDVEEKTEADDDDSTEVSGYEDDGDALMLD